MQVELLTDFTLFIRASGLRFIRKINAKSSINNLLLSRWSQK